MTLPLPSDISRLPSQLLTVDLGVMAYGEALEVQRSVAKRRIAGEIDQDVLLLVEHPHVITLGRSSKAGHLLADVEALAARGVELFEVERGGDVTYHGPGQLVGYPIVDLKRHKQDLHWYLRQVEEVLILALRAFMVEGTRNAGLTGVWVAARSDEPGVRSNDPSPAAAARGGTEDVAHSAPTARRSPRKIASIGVHARDWVTWHGFALNVTTDLTYFDLMVPCGIPNITMTSIEREVAEQGAGGRPTIDSCKTAVSDAFATVFGLEH